MKVESCAAAYVVVLTQEEAQALQWAEVLGVRKDTMVSPEKVERIMDVLGKFSDALTAAGHHYESILTA